MKHIQLKLVATVNKYTTEKVEDRHYIKNINLYPAEDPNYFWGHRAAFISYDRIMELQPIAMQNGYLFTY
jgi:hypothetical protein